MTPPDRHPDHVPGRPRDHAGDPHGESTTVAGRTLALDLGERRIGLALSDPTGLIAQPLRVLERQGWLEDVTAIRRIVEAHGVGRIVVGYPLTLAGTVGPAAERVDRIIRRLREALGPEILRWDERLTTAAAERPLLEAGLRRSRRRRVRDAVAAAVLLQSFLDHERAGQTPRG